MDSINLSDVKFIRPTRIWGMGVVTDVFDSYNGVDWIQAHTFGVRVKFGDQFTLIPWHNVEGALEDPNG